MAQRPAKLDAHWTGSEDAAYFPSRNAAIPERALLPEEGWAGRQRGASQAVNLCQSVDFAPVRGPHGAADRLRNPLGALRPAPAGQLRTRFQTRRGGATPPVFFGVFLRLP